MGARILNEIFEKMEAGKHYANPQGKKSFPLPDKLWADEMKVVGLWNLLHVETSAEAKYDPILSRADAFQEGAIVESTLVRKWSFLVMENLEAQEYLSRDVDLVTAAKFVFGRVFVTIQEKCGVFFDNFFYERESGKVQVIKLAALYIGVINTLTETIYSRRGWLNTEAPGFRVYRHRQKSWKTEDPRLMMEGADPNAKAVAPCCGQKRVCSRSPRQGCP
jgi:hypothetical protein